MSVCSDVEEFELPVVTLNIELYKSQRILFLVICVSYKKMLVFLKSGWKILMYYGIF